MTSEAREFLDAWTLQQGSAVPLSDADAAILAEQWTADAQQNGIAADDLRAAADGDIVAFLQRIFGREESSPVPD